MILPFLGAFLVLYGVVALVTDLFGISNYLVDYLSIATGFPPLGVSFGIIMVGVAVFFLSRRVEDPLRTPLLGDRLESLGCLGCMIALLVPASCAAAFVASYFPSVFGLQPLPQRVARRIGQLTATSTPACQNERALDNVYRSIDALNAEDPAAYMLTIHPQSKFQGQDYVDELYRAFQTFDARQEISDVQLAYAHTQEAKVSFVMMVDFNSPDFQDTKITGAYILRCHEGNWLIFDDEISKVEPQP